MDRFMRVIEEFIRPALMAHQGDIQLIGINEGIVKFKLTGACAGCPSADNDTKDFIEKHLKEHFGWVKAVEIDQTVNPELMDFAKKILSKGAQK